MFVKNNTMTLAIGFWQFIIIMIVIIFMLLPIRLIRYHLQKKKDKK
jgi:hypothetical protein